MIKGPHISLVLYSISSTVKLITRDIKRKINMIDNHWMRRKMQKRQCFFLLIFFFLRFVNRIRKKIFTTWKSLKKKVVLQRYQKKQPISMFFWDSFLFFFVFLVRLYWNIVFFVVFLFILHIVEISSMLITNLFFNFLNLPFLKITWVTIFLKKQKKNSLFH